MGKSQFSRHRTSRTTKDTRTTQAKLLVARSKRRYQEICARLFQMLAKQSPTPEEIRRVTSIKYSIRTIARNQY